LKERIIGCLLLLALLGYACAAPVPPKPRPRLRLTTGTPGGSFHPLGAALASAFRADPGGFDVEVRESAGSVSNVEAIQRAEADVGFAFADVVYTAFVGQLEGNARPFDRLRGVAVMGLTPMHFVASATSEIRDVPGLRGRRVGVGRPGSGTALSAGLVLRAHGLQPGDVRVEALGYNEAAERLAAGTLDALFVDGSYPLDSVTRATRAGSRLLPLRGASIDRLRHEYPFLGATVIPGGTYPGHSASVHTVGVDNVLVCTSRLEEAVVYEVTRRFHEALPSLAANQQALRFMDLEQAPATPIPLHEGAARYYRERELSQ
jgi:uncharacterized protein